MGKPTVRGHLKSADYKMCQVNAAGNQEFRALALKETRKQAKAAGKSKVARDEGFWSHALFTPPQL